MPPFSADADHRTPTRLRHECSRDESDIHKLQSLTTPDGAYAYACGLHLIIDGPRKTLAQGHVYVAGARDEKLTRWFIERFRAAPALAPHADEEALKPLLKNARDFLNGGIQLLFSKRARSGDGKLAVVAIQTALELLAKYRLVETKGLPALVKGKLPPGDLSELGRAGQFRTLGYQQAL